MKRWFPAAMLGVLAACGSAPAPPSSAAAPPYFTPDPKTAVTVRGKAVYRGPRLPANPLLRIDEDAACVALNKRGLRAETVLARPSGELANVFVWVKKGLEGKRFAPPPPAAAVTIDQKSCRFGPHVIGVRVGQLLRVTNSDPVTHNIHPMPAMNREWNQSQEPGAPALERKFVRPETMMRVKCNVHSWMRAYVSVLDHPYFATTAADGTFEIAGLPPGEYTFEAWQEKFGPVEIAVSLGAGEARPLEFVFTGETRK